MYRREEKKKQGDTKSDVVEHFHPDTDRRIMGSRPAWATRQVPDEPGIPGKTKIQNKTKQNLNVNAFQSSCQLWCNQIS